MKQSFKFIVGMSLVTSAFLSCGPNMFEQDPLTGYSNDIKNAKPTVEKPRLQDPLKSEAVRVIGSEILSFKEGRLDKYAFKVNILLPDYEGELFIDNMDLFPGSTFDAKTGEFVWTPQRGTVTQPLYQELELVVVAVAKKINNADDVIHTNTRKIPVIVYRQTSQPSIARVERTENVIREGGSALVSVTIKDDDGGLDPESSPELIILPGANGTNLAPFVTVQNIKADIGKKEWKYDLRINLFNTEITDSVIRGDFSVKAANRFGQPSAESKIEYTIYTKLSSLEVIWDQQYDMIPGQTNSVPFMVYDPKGEGVLSQLSQLTLPSGAQIKCAQPRSSVLNCQLIWNPPFNRSPQAYNWSFVAESKNKATADKVVVTQKHNFAVRVAYKEFNTPNPTPTPSPTPRPGPTPSPTNSPDPGEATPIPGPTFKIR